ncbi:MAG: hypothetical protein DDT29_00039 [Dehalococcoidia bacterium]|nr:hypothetical protein [Bacillota bacterium]
MNNKTLCATILLFASSLLIIGGCPPPPIDYDAPMRFLPPAPGEPRFNIDPDLGTVVNRVGETRVLSITFHEPQTVLWKIRIGSRRRAGMTLCDLAPPILIKREENVAFSELEIKAERVGIHSISVSAEWDDSRFAGVSWWWEVRP